MRLEEPDADGPQEIRAAEVGVPEDGHPADLHDSLDDFFGHPAQHGPEAEANEAIASRAKLAEFFARPQDPAAPAEDPLASEPVARVGSALPWASVAPKPAPERAPESAPTPDPLTQSRSETASEPLTQPESAPTPEPAPDWASGFHWPLSKEDTEDETSVLEAFVPPAVASTFLAGAATPEEPSPGGDVAKPPKAPRSGIRGALFGSRARASVSVAASVVLVAGLVAGAFFGQQAFAANARLVEARSNLQSAESAIVKPTGTLSSSQAQYDGTVADANAVVGSATPALAAVGGMSDPAALDSAKKALAAVIASLDKNAAVQAPSPYKRARIDTSNLVEVKAATRGARDYLESVASAQSAVEAARADLIKTVLALTAAQNALGSSLPATAEGIVTKNDLAEQSFKDAVTAAAAAVVAAQSGGASGNDELIAYASAVNALRTDQQRALDEQNSRSGTYPPTGTTNPGRSNSGPGPAPTPAPSPPPTRPPAPTPSPTPTPEPSPSPSDPPPDPTPTP